MENMGHEGDSALVKLNLEELRYLARLVVHDEAELTPVTEDLQVGLFEAIMDTQEDQITHGGGRTRRRAEMAGRIDSTTSDIDGFERASSSRLTKF